MSVKQKSGGRASAIPGGIALGVLAALIVTILGAVVLTALIAGETMEIGVFGYGAMAVQLLSALAGAVVAMLKIKHRKMQVCLLTGLAYYLVMLAMNALFFGGQYEGALTSALLILMGSGVAAIVGTREGKMPKRRHKIPAYR